MRNFLNLIKRFRSDERGAFLVIFGLMAIVLVATAGAVVDFTTVEQARTRAQDALDSAALGLQPTIYDTGVTATTLQASAQQLLDERILDNNVVATVTQAIPNTGEGKLELRATLTVQMAFVSLVGVTQISANVLSEATRGSIDLEVAVALDTTGSMDGQKIIDLRAATNSLIDIIVQDVQEPTYTKLALVPYSMAVNVGTYAASIRGAVTGPTTITNVSWATGTTKNISGAAWAVASSSFGVSAITKAFPARVTTASNHGYSTGDTVYLSGISGMTQVNNKIFTITKVSNTQFTLNGINSTNYNTYSNTSGDAATRCQTSACEVVITSNSHGFADGDTIYIKSISGMTQLNGRSFVVSNKTTNTYVLSGEVGVTHSAYSSNGNAQKCQVTVCKLVVTTSTAHGMADNDYVTLTSVGGVSYSGDNINQGDKLAWQITSVSGTKYSLQGSFGPQYSAYTSGGSSQCAMPGCQYLRFINANGSERLFQVTTCATERTGTNAYTEVAPSTEPMGRNYRSNGSCIGQTIVPLTTDKTVLHATANGLTASGSTGGHLGIAWAWYMISPEFAYLWPAASQPAAYPDEDDRLLKVVILMTDGAFNTVYNTGVIAANSISGSGSTSEHINQNAANGSALVQGEAQCSAMKTAGVIVYTVGFDIGTDVGATNLMTNCASDPSKAYLVATGAQLTAAFQDIAQNIASLRVTK